MEEKENGYIKNQETRGIHREHGKWLQAAERNYDGKSADQGFCRGGCSPEDGR